MKQAIHGKTSEYALAAPANCLDFSEAGLFCFFGEYSDTEEAETLNGFSLSGFIRERRGIP